MVPQYGPSRGDPYFFTRYVPQGPFGLSHPRPDFSDEAKAMLAVHRPHKGATTDAVARRLIAGPGGRGLGFRV